MRPLLLKGHERPITDVKFNVDGDMIFISSKDSGISVWWTDTGERIGTYDGHSGACWMIDVTDDSTRLLSCGADNYVRLWDVESGKMLEEWKHHNCLRCCAFSHGGRHFVSVTDDVMKLKPVIRFFKTPTSSEDYEEMPYLEIDAPTRILRVLWGYRNETIITACKDGYIRVYDTKTGELVKEMEVHKKEVTEIQYDKTKTLFISSSTDGNSTLFDAIKLEPITTYETGRPLNAASISPLMDHVIVGGGEQASQVTQTGATSDQFKVRFYHSIFSEELGSVLGHFGPVNVLCFSPDGKSFASGSEDGFVRLHNMDPEYFERKAEVSTFEG
jgi:translation initiation factor 3 subunit I